MKKALLDNLKHDTYCRVGVSKIHGVGVIAVRNIPKGVDPFRTTNRRSYRFVNLTAREVNSLPLHSRKLIKDFISPEDNGSYYVPHNGMNGLDVSFYMNHSNDNNISMHETSDDFVQFYANRNIRKGEELFINYDEF